MLYAVHPEIPPTQCPRGKPGHMQGEIDSRYVSTVTVPTVAVLALALPAVCFDRDVHAARTHVR